MLSSRIPRMAQSTQSPMTVYLADMSYFSGKMEAYLRYKEIPYERRLATSKTMRGEVLRATGLMKVPVIRLPDGQWLKDTTPMIDWFEGALPPRGRARTGHTLPADRARTSGP